MFTTQRRILFAIALILCLVFASTFSAWAQVWTDQEDYAPGSVVTISGGNDENGAPGYVTGAAVDVIITGPHDPAYESTTCQNVMVGDNGAWSCILTLWSELDWAVGSYTYTAASIAADGSPIIETGAFTDTRTITDVKLTADGVTVPTGSLTVGPGETISAQVIVYLTSLGDKNWKSSAWAITDDPLALLQKSAWHCVNHANHASPTSWPYSGTYNETFDITAPSPVGTYFATFYAFATDDCFTNWPLWSNPWVLLNIITVVKAPGSVSINNIPTDAVYGGSFTPTFDKLGDGSTSVASLTTDTCTVTGGVVNYAAAGTCTLQASIAEGTQYLAATGPEQSFTIAQAGTTTTLSVAPNTHLLNETFTFTATVAAVSPATGTPTGTVNFYDGSTLLAENVALLNGEAVFSTADLAIGPHAITAVYSGSANWLGSTSTAVNLSVTFNFIGFTAPVDNPDIINITKAGQSVPLKFRLLDFYGNPILDLASVKVTVVSLSCTIGATSDAIEEYAAGSSGLQNLGDGYYQWNWKTPTSYANSCKTLKLDLGEGAGNEHIAYFQFRK